MSNPRLTMDEDFRESCREDVHPALRRRNWPEPETAKCRACGKRLELAHLTDDLLCRDCDEAVKELEAICQ